MKEEVIEEKIKKTRLSSRRNRKRGASIQGEDRGRALGWEGRKEF